MVWSAATRVHLAVIGNGMADGEREIWIGLQGPLRVSDEGDPRRDAFRRAGRIAQAATTLEQLVALVRDHSDPLVRLQAIPRLRARFPEAEETESVLIGAAQDGDDGVRRQAYGALADLPGDVARGALRRGLQDASAKVRLMVAAALHDLGDAEAPADPEAWAYDPLN